MKDLQIDVPRPEYNLQSAVWKGINLLPLSASLQPAPEQKQLFATEPWAQLEVSFLKRRREGGTHA